MLGEGPGLPLVTVGAFHSAKKSPAVVGAGLIDGGETPSWPWQAREFAAAVVGLQKGPRPRYTEDAAEEAAVSAGL
jgi:hypothetical protein